MLRRRYLLAALLTAPLALPAPAALAQAPAARLRGTIAAHDGDTLVVVPRGGEKVTLALRADTTVTAIIPAKLSDIKSGSFIGTAAMPGPNESVVALEIHIFPEAMRGTGEGHRPYDLQADSSMTNGTVGSVVVSNGRTLTVGYKGGQQTVQVPEDTPIVAFEPGTRAQLVPGAHVIVFPAKAADGTLAAARVLVGKDGMVPPL